MRTIYSLLSPLAAVALSAAAVRPAAAQTAAATEYIRPVVERAERTTDALPRPLVVYRFTRSHDVIMPSQVVVADSAGQLVATFRLAGSSDVRPMQVDVMDSDIVLQGETPSGVLTLVFYGQNDFRVEDSLAGRWTLGSRQGELHGRVSR
jgi:hypothetical protein